MRTEETLELRRTLGVLRRWAWLIVACTLLALVIALVVTALMPDTYEATTTLLVAAEQTGMSEYSTLMAGQMLALTYDQMLKSQSTLETVISRLELDKTPEALAASIKTETVQNTQLIRVTARDTSPQRAALIANTVAEIFIEYAKALPEGRYRDYMSNMEAKIEAQRKEIDETQALIDEVSVRKVSDEAELTRVQGLLAEYRSTQRALQQDEQSLQLLAAQAKDSVKVVEQARLPAAEAQTPYTATVLLLVDEVTDNPSVLPNAQLAETYARMMAEPAILEAVATKLEIPQTGDALGVSVKAEPVAGTQLVQLRVAGADVPNTVLLANAIAEAFVEQIQELLGKPYASRLTNMQTEITELSKLIEETQAEVEAHTAASLQSGSELARLEAMQAEHRSDYRLLQQDYEELQLTAVEAPTTVLITERAHDPQAPAQNRIQYVLLATLIGMLLSVSAAFVIEYLDESIKTPDDVRNTLGLSTLGMIEQFGKEQDQSIVAAQPQSQAAEAFRILATNIRLSSVDGQLRTILVTSPAPVDGKSVVAANLAVAMAGAGLRVVVVDADLRRPRQHQIFGLSQGQGLTYALWQGSTSGHVKSTDVERVRILTSGTLPPDPVGLLSSPRMNKLLDDLVQDADLVIIDTPPVLAVADTSILAAGVDGVLLVLQAGHTRSQAARQAVEALRQAKARVLGVVLNAVPSTGDRYYRYYSAIDESAGSLSQPKKLLGPFSWRLPGLGGGLRRAPRTAQLEPTDHVAT